MRAINTMQKEEYAERLSEAMRRMSKKIYRLMDEEDSLSTKADNQGDEEKALLHAFNSRALLWASEAIVIAPDKLKERLAEINRREFVPTINGTKVMKQNLSDMYYCCERCGLLIRKPNPFNPKVIPIVKINGKLYCPNCVKYDEETEEFKPKERRTELWE